MLSTAQVSDALKGWRIMYPEAGYDSNALAYLTAEYHESLQSKGITESSLTIICKVAKERCHFFPKIKDLLDIYEEYSANPERYCTESIPQIAPEYWSDKTDEEVAMNKKRMAILLKVATRQITTEEGLRLQAKLTGESCEPI